MDHGKDSLQFGKGNVELDMMAVPLGCRQCWPAAAPVVVPVERWAASVAVSCCLSTLTRLSPGSAGRKVSGSPSKFWMMMHRSKGKVYERFPQPSKPLMLKGLDRS
jgi:hypothetical protein